MNKNTVAEEARQVYINLIRHQELVTDARLIERIGKGSYGTIYRATKHSTCETIAIKIVRFETEEQKQKSLEEAKIHSSLDHKNIVKLFKYYMKERFLIMYLEFFHGVVLADFLVRGWVWGQRYCIKDQIIEGMNNALKYLHCQNLAHGDIHACNVMVRWNGDVKLIDFGSADDNIFKIAYDREKANMLCRDIETAKEFKKL